MRLPVFLICLLASLALNAQSSSAPGTKQLSLAERYWQMKTSTQTFKEYKVIPEVMLDAEWRIVRDTLASNHTQLNLSKAEVRKLESELQSAQRTIKEKDASMAENAYAAEHIDFMGWSFIKAVFVGLAVAITAGLVLLIVLLAGRLKIMHSELKEKTTAATDVALELEEYKRKALEKQSKLSRELQNERNRLQELKKSA